MKTCPVCKTSLFDDMEVCYGCMYAFGSKPELEQRAAQERARTEIPLQGAQQSPQSDAPMAGWSIRLEMRDTADPARSWSMELSPSSVMTGAAVCAPAAI